MASSTVSTISDVLSSPTISTSSSFDMLSVHSRSSTMSSFHHEDSDDEIVWSVSEASMSSSDVSSESSVNLPSDDDDFVVLNRSPRVNHTGFSTPNAERVHVSSSTSELATGLAQLSVNDTNQQVSPSAGQRSTYAEPSAKRRRNRRRAAASCGSEASPSPSQSERPSSAATFTKGTPQLPITKKPKRSFSRRKKQHSTAINSTGLGARPIVDDISERASERSETPAVPSMYEEAVTYITSFLSNPSARDSVSHLTLLQSLIVELGLATSTLPSSLTSAKAFLKSRAFLNIREYIAVRSEGPAALQRVMHPSRSALIKDIKKKRNPASLRWVKQNGLQVLLVSCYH